MKNDESIKNSKKVDKILKALDKHPISAFTEYLIDFADIVYRELKSQRITEKQFAEKIGKSEEDVISILYADSDMTIETMVDVLWGLGLKPTICTVPR